MRAATFVLLAACGFDHGAVPTDAAAGSDAALPRKQMEVVAGAGRLTAGTITLDVEIGRAVPVAKVSAGTITISGAAAVTP